jgi:hypothetical protein
MEIQFTRDVRDPDTKEILHHKGERYHCKTSVGDDYIERKAAEKVRYASYVDRLRAAATAPRQVHSSDNSVSPPQLTPGWGIVKRGAPEKYFIQQTTETETLLFAGVPSDCPAAVAKQLVELNGLSADTPEAREARRIADCEKQNAELANKEKEKSVFQRILGGH